MIARLLIALLRGYKKYISPHLGHHCRFIPTCSEYAMQALAVHGLVKGLILTVWRLLRCQPFAKFGYDPVPEKGKWVNPERRLTKDNRWDMNQRAGYPALIDWTWNRSPKRCSSCSC